MLEKVAIVILSYNNVKDTVECIKSIYSNIERNLFEIFLIDNSTDEYYLKNIESKVNVYFSAKVNNNGYSHGNNVGIRKAISLNFKYIMILNNDTIVTRDCLQKLIDKVNNDENIGIVAPLIKRYSDNKIWSSGGSYRKLLCNYQMTSKYITSDAECEFLTGCCFLAKSILFQNIGLLKEDYFMYNEDSEFCHRLKMYGYKNYLVKNSVVLHKVSVSSEANSPFQLYYIYRNRIGFCYYEFKGLKRIYAINVNKLQALYRYLILKKEGQRKEAKAVYYAILDYKKINGKGRY